MIFALVLTIAYAIYYAVVIAKDLQGKKGRTNSTEEVFDLDGMEEEESVEVSEAGDGFQVGNAGERPMIPSESGKRHHEMPPKLKPMNLRPACWRPT